MATAPIKAKPIEAKEAKELPPPFKLATMGETQKYLKLLIYGDYGSGKTFLSGTAADIPFMSNVILISAESGDLTLRSNKEHKFDQIDQVQCNSFNTTARVYEFLKAHCLLRDTDTPEALQKMRELEAKLRGCKVEAIKEPKRYRTVIIDSLSEVEAYSMNQLLGISDSSRLDSEVMSAEWAEYKKNHSAIQRFVRNFRNLPMHVIFTCARQYTQDEQKRQHFTLQLTGKLSSQVQGFMDMVGYLMMGPQEVKGETKIVRRLYVQPVGRFSAKCRFSNFTGNFFEAPTMKSILQGVKLLE